MNNNRRAFFKRTSMAGLGLAGAPLLDGVASALDIRKTRKQRFNMSGYAAPKIEKVRVLKEEIARKEAEVAETMALRSAVEESRRSGEKGWDRELRSWEERVPVSPEPDRLSPHRGSAHRPFQLALCPAPRGQVHSADRGYGCGAIHR